jgi:ferredoxin
LERITDTTHRRKITFIDKDGKESTFEVADGDNLLDIAQENDIEMEGMCLPSLPSPFHKPN